MARTLLKAIHTAYTGSLLPSAWKFSHALKNPGAAQQQRFVATVSAHADTAYGKQFGFEKINSIKAYQERVPTTDYDALAPWIERIKQGEQRVLTTAPVLMLERTGGSTGANKYIPFTSGLLAEISAATNAWLWDLYRNVPHLMGTQAYWSVSPANQHEKQTQGGIPIGLEDEAAYFGPLARWALRQMMCVPADVRNIKESAAWQLQTLVGLVNARDLGFISVWSPTFLSVLVDALESNPAPVLRALSREARGRLRKALASSKLDTRILWPQLRVISCWNDGISAGFALELQSRFPHVFIQGKGLLATEGVVTVPFGRIPDPTSGRQTATHGGVIAINSHFYEFIDLNNAQGRPLLVDELKMGGEYSPLLTTSGGLYRYHLKDVVKCTGYRFNTPELIFVGKLDRVSDLCGEKLHATFVENALNDVIRETGIEVSFALLSPSRTPERHYQLFIETPQDTAHATQITEQLEQKLRQSHHYGYCRQLGQLGALQSKPVHDGWRTYQQHLVRHGQRLGDIKPTRLDSRHDWNSIFSNQGEHS